jgi:tRNA/rRNA methyltransferase
MARSAPWHTGDNPREKPSILAAHDLASARRSHAFRAREHEPPGQRGVGRAGHESDGLFDLVLVAPRFADVLSREETQAMASGATEVLERARIVGTLAERWTA